MRFADDSETVMNWGSRRIPVPYATRWTGERVIDQEVTIRPDGTGVRVLGETAAARDQYGVLWGQVREVRGKGRPDFSSLHPTRQRRALAERLCQVCDGPASHTRDGWLFLLNADEIQDTRDVEGAKNTSPPVCLRCADLATRFCPHLGNPMGIRVRRPRIWGVFGTVYTVTPAGRLEPHHDEYMPYGHPATGWFIASQLVVELRRCTVVDLVAESVIPG
ncbi:hypothetical protein [Streptomyces sp. NPDC049879]|uniref:hypothetical protein n=1 Tax=Streptomyces sp. NPDC049879 TaxID=3365598 RepID=UPI00378E44AA